MFDARVHAELELAAGQTGIAEADLGRLTTLGCGGPAALLIETDSAKRLAAVLAVTAAREIDWFIIGLGSNLLVADTGWDGLVIRLSGELKRCEALPGGKLSAGAGASLPRAAATAADAGLTGLEPLAAIPGTVGGAVAMNAGAWGTNIGDLVEQVEVCLPGESRLLEADSLTFSYRNCQLPPGCAVSRTVLAMTPDEPAAIRAAMQDYRRRREESQPIGERTCGSVFRNPPGEKSAGELLAHAGCKGMVRGAAAVSTTHANFIVNKVGASASDVIGLMDECRRRVYEESGISLEPEVRLLGEIELKPVQ
ncbi:MAG: UDP-N-acetylmuramate dehydrogenase [Thermoleophilia bacterium]|nr:UDP-N-acetylmuramate dehydrogenase [Thermoleophilia bacterium]